MSISTTQTLAIGLGNGSNLSFNFSFSTPLVASDIVVSYVNASGAITELNPSQYTLVINTPAPGQLWGIGGSVTYPVSGTPIASGTSILIERILPLIQSTSLTNIGAYSPTAVEGALDQLEMQIQQVATDVALAPQFPPNYTGYVPQFTLPIVPGDVLAYDSNGNITGGAGGGGGGGGSGSVSSVGTGTGLTGGPITTSGTISIANNTDNTLAGFNASGVFSNVVIGSGVNLSGGTLSATGAITSVSNADGTLTVSPTSGAVVASLAALPNAQILVGNGSNVAAPVAVSGDATLSNLGAITVTKTNGTAFGTMATQNASAVAITGGAITGMNQPVNGSDVANKTYVDNAVSGTTLKAACVSVNTTSLTVNYSNGSSGIGATLTNSSALTQFTTSDGISPNTNARVLIAGQSGAQFQNGIYSVTNIGSGAVAWVLTRTTDFDTSATIAYGDNTIITTGTVYAGTTWVQTASGPFTVGTTAITFIASQAAASVTTLTGNVTGTGTGSIATTIANNAVTTAMIQNNAITNSLIATSSANTLAGYSSIGAFSDVAVGTGLSLSGGTLASTGAITGLDTNPNLVIASGLLGINATIYNVKDYGAKGDGSTNDNTAITNCIAAAAGSTNGGIVYFPQGSYVVTEQFAATLSTTQTLYLRGDGPGVSKLKWTTSTGGVSITFAGAGLSGLGLVGAEGLEFTTLTAGGGVGLSLINNNAPNLGPIKRIVNCSFSNNGSSSYWTQAVLFDACDWVTMTDCRFYDSTLTGVGIQIQNSQISTSDAAEYIFQGLQFNSGTCINATSGIEGIICSGCSFGGVNGIVYEATTGPVTNPPELSVVGCFFVNRDYAIITQNISQITIDSNLFYNYLGSAANNYVGIYIDNSSSAGYSDCTIISNNIILGFGKSNTIGIAFTNVEYSKIHDNRIDSCTSGIILESGSNYNIVRNNYVTNFTNNITDNGTGNLCINDLAGYSALVYLSSPQSISNDTPTIISWTNADHDPLSCWNGSTELVVPSGVSKVKVAAGGNFAASSGNISMNIFKNGAGTYVGCPGFSGAPSPTGNSLVTVSSGLLYVSSGDYFTVEVVQQSGGALNFGTAKTWFSMEIIG